MQATQVFWAKGYDGASMKDLTQAMGINSPSLYAAFGDKEALYLKTIDSYVNNDACAPLVAFEQERDITGAVAAFFATTVAYATSQPGGNRGCYLASCVAVNAVEMDGARARLERAIAQTDARLAARFDLEKTAGHLRADFPSLARARLMFDLRQGLVFRARAGLAAHDIMADVDHKIASVLA